MDIDVINDKYKFIVAQTPSPSYYYYTEYYIVLREVTTKLYT